MEPETEKKYLEMGKDKPLPQNMKYPGWILNCDCNKCKAFRKDNKIPEKEALEGARSYEND